MLGLFSTQHSLDVFEYPSFFLQYLERGGAHCRGPPPPHGRKPLTRGRARDALKITRLPLSTGPFLGGPSTRAPHHVSAPSCAQEYPAHHHPAHASAVSHHPPRPSSLPGCLSQERILGDWRVRTGNPTVGIAEAIFFRGRDGGEDWHKTRHCCIFSPSSSYRGENLGWGGEVGPFDFFQ